MTFHSAKRRAHRKSTSLCYELHGRPLKECLTGLRTSASSLHHIYGFRWWQIPLLRLTFLDGKKRWTAYVAELRCLGLNPNILLDFVADDSPEALTDDVLFLNELLCAPARHQ